MSRRPPPAVPGGSLAPPLPSSRPQIPPRPRPPASQYAVHGDAEMVPIAVGGGSHHHETPSIQFNWQDSPWNAQTGQQPPPPYPGQSRQGEADHPTVGSGSNAGKSKYSKFLLYFVIVALVLGGAFVAYSYFTSSIIFASSDSGSTSADRQISAQAPLSSPPQGQPQSPLSNAWDSNSTSYYVDAAANAWIGLQLPGTEALMVTQVQLFAKPGNEAQWSGARLEIDTDSQCLFSASTRQSIGTWGTQNFPLPTGNQFNTYSIDTQLFSTPARCVRVVAPSGLYIAELKFFGRPNSGTPSAASSSSTAMNPGPATSTGVAAPSSSRSSSASARSSSSVVSSSRSVSSAVFTSSSRLSSSSTGRSVSSSALVSSSRRVSSSVSSTGGSQPISSSAGGFTSQPPQLNPNNTNIWIENVYAIQAVQNWTNSIPIVSDRAALVRVFVLADAFTTLQPQVRLSIYDGTTLLNQYMISPPASTVPRSVNQLSLRASWNQLIPSTEVKTNFRFVAELDPFDVIPEPNEGDNRWPRAAGTTQSMPTVVAPTLNLRIFSVIVNGTQGNYAGTTVAGWTGFLAAIFPVGAMVTSTRATFTSSVPGPLMSDGTRWSTVLSQVNVLRGTDSAPSNLFYYGVVPTTYGGGVAGMGYVPGRASIGWDRSVRDEVYAHELGHNFGLSHVACSGEAGTDPRYPIPNGRIDLIGSRIYGIFDSRSNALYDPSNYRDIMSYCSPKWISDYHWMKTVNNRAFFGAMVVDASGSGSGTGELPPETGIPMEDMQLQQPQDVLVVHGIIIDGHISVEPAFRFTASPTRVPLASDPGATHKLLVLDSKGAVLLEQPIVPIESGHPYFHDVPPVEQPHSLHFHALLPWSDELELTAAVIRVQTRSMGRLEESRSGRVQSNNCPDHTDLALRTPSSSAAVPGSAKSRVPHPRIPQLSMPHPSAEISPHVPKEPAPALTGNLVQLHWNHRDYPMAVAKSKQTGEILAFIKDPGHVFETSGHEIDFIFSDGVKSIQYRHEAVESSSPL